MTYRSPEAALRERIAAIEADVAELEARRDRLEAEVDALARSQRALEERLETEGPGGGVEGARRLGIPVVVGCFFAVSVLLLPLELYIASYVRNDPEETIVPLLLLCGPGLTTFLVAHPYRRLAKGYRPAAIAGLCFVSLNLLFVGAGVLLG